MGADTSEWRYATLFIQTFRSRTRHRVEDRLTTTTPDPKLKEMGTICTPIAMAFNGYRPDGGAEIFGFMNKLFGINITYHIDIPS